MFFGLFGDDTSDKKPKFRVGERVRVKYRGQEGWVVDVNGPLVMVSLDDGRHVDSYYESDLERSW